MSTHGGFLHAPNGISAHFQSTGGVTNEQRNRTKETDCRRNCW